MMPREKRFEFGYGSASEGGARYREISEQMTAMGDKMNHSTARNILMSALEKLAAPLCLKLNDNGKGLDPKVVARDPRFQDSLVTLLEELGE